MRPELPPTVCLAGPTGVGKSAIALALAERVGGEIVSVDSMQVYRGLDIGTAKPSAADRLRVSHHLIDVADVREGFDAARFVRLASAAAEDIASRGRAVILCGGTGLYFKALLEGLEDTPPSDPQLRVALEATPLPVLLEELAARAPATFERIDRQNPRRVVRALEVIRLTGQPLSARRELPPSPLPSAIRAAPIVVFARAPADLRARINSRVDSMFALGLVEETRRLLASGLGANRTAMQAIGYRQVCEYLDRGGDLGQTIDLVKARTWQFARRQMTWFRHQLHVHWFHLDPDASPTEVARAVARVSQSGEADGSWTSGVGDSGGASPVKRTTRLE